VAIVIDLAAFQDRRWPGLEVIDGRRLSGSYGSDGRGSGQRRMARRPHVRDLNLLQGGRPEVIWGVGEWIGIYAESGGVQSLEVSSLY
jgi:hypothetical protein